MMKFATLLLLVLTGVASAETRIADRRTHAITFRFQPTTVGEKKLSTWKYIFECGRPLRR